MVGNLHQCPRIALRIDAAKRRNDRDSEKLPAKLPASREFEDLMDHIAGFLLSCLNSSHSNSIEKLESTSAAHAAVLRTSLIAEGSWSNISGRMPAFSMGM